MRRIVEPELLDTLPSSDVRAARARADLRRLNGILGHARILTNAFYQHLNFDTARRRSLQICELGAGDGTLLLNGCLLACAVQFLRNRDRESARRLFLASIVYLPLLLTLMMFAFSHSGSR